MGQCDIFMTTNKHLARQHDTVNCSAEVGVGDNARTNRTREGWDSRKHRHHRTLNRISQVQVTLQDSADDWTYRRADTKQITHGIHPYPAMMIPQVARRRIATYGCYGAVLFDPYCGSGTTLLAGFLAGMNAVGTDLNPLARLIARVKTTPLDIDALDNEAAHLPVFSSSAELPTPPITNPVTNIDYWFAASAQHDLAALRLHIDAIGNPVLADALRVAFALTVREASWTRKSEFKLCRMLRSQMARHKPQPLVFMAQATTNVRRALQALNAVAPAATPLPAVHQFNTVHGVPADTLAPESVDLVVTSPPYGDSKTTVAYGQFSRLASQWLGFADASRIDTMLMGGGKLKRVAKFGFPKLDDTIARIAEIDERRACEVASFFADYQASISHVATRVARGGHACYVVGNRTVKSCVIPTAEATAAFFESNGFTTEAMCTRNIPNKRMPAANSPSNVRGAIGKTMTTEKIVICRKIE